MLLTETRHKTTMLINLLIVRNLYIVFIDLLMNIFFAKIDDTYFVAERAYITQSQIKNSWMAAALLVVFSDVTDLSWNLKLRNN